MRIGFATDKGKSRASNQDSVLASAEYRCIAVADGLGGHNGGTEASNIAVGIFAMRCKDATTLEDLKAILESANSAIRAQAEIDPDLAGMGTTMTVCAVRSKSALLAHVGDSRAYLIREGASTRLSTDHSLAGQPIQSGFLKLEDAAYHPGKHAVIRCLGACDELEPELKQIPLEADDVLVVCTDGFWDQINEIEMAERFSATQDMMTVCEDLTRLANIRGGEDNITVVAALIEESDVS